ncbi:MAG: GNAT family N-acetyltransferase [Arthrospira sp. SH-MAG29]|nr:GNAT family N-acetyltransferase [Arthrospira sp. SH-MAG29]MBS0017008.1 GNAT family N-acetyltransferase [Arthrospira sp. SH-MAG29]
MTTTPNFVTSQITIRPYRDRDWEEVCQVHDRAGPAEFAGSCDLRGMRPLSENPYIARIFPLCRKFVACDGKKVIGIMAIYQGYIILLYIDPDYQHQGIGCRLLRLAINLIGSPAWTIVMAGNQNAIRFYEKAGFVKVETFENTVSGYPCNFIRMKRAYGQGSAAQESPRTRPYPL